MEIRTAQQDIQKNYLRGSVGQVVSGVIWFISAALATWTNERSAIIFLVLVGIFIFPLTSLILRILRKKSGLPKNHPFNILAMLIAFIVPFSLPVIGAASLYNINWFYPAFMLILGTHYLPFIFLYGMWEFGLLSTILISGGLVIGILLPNSFTVGGWLTSATLVLFAIFVQFTPRLKKREI